MDDFGGSTYPQAAMEGGVGNMLRQKQMPTYTQRVEQAVIDAEERLKDLKRMQEIFAKHPEFEELLTLVQRGRV